MRDEKLMALMTDINPTVLQVDEVLQASKLNVEQEVAVLLTLAVLQLERRVLSPKMTEVRKEAMKDEGICLARKAVMSGPVVVMSLLGCLVEDLNDLLPVVRTVKAAERMVCEAGGDA